MRSWLLAVPLLVGCSHSEPPPSERKFSELRDEVTRLQTERDKVSDRLAALEVEASRGKENAESPRLRVIRLAPEPPELPQAEEISGESAGYTDDAPEAPRPMVRLSGGGKHARSEVQSSVSTEIAPTGKRPSALDPDARHAYDDAQALVKARRWPEAANAFTTFLVRYPDHPYASNAMFWRAEVFLAQGDAAHAITEYEGAIARFPLGNKTPDALLKLGMTLEKQGDKARADAAYERLAREFPMSDPARRIPNHSSRVKTP